MLGNLPLGTVGCGDSSASVARKEKQHDTFWETSWDTSDDGACTTSCVVHQELLLTDILTEITG